MKLFKKPTQSGEYEVYAFEVDGTQDGLITEDMTLITDEEADVIRLPKFSVAETQEARRAQIDAALAQIDAKRTRALSDVTLALASGVAAPQSAIDKLASLEAQAVQLRSERRSIDT